MEKLINTFLIIYYIIVFMIPWTIFVYYLIKLMKHIIDNDYYWILSKENRLKYRNWLKNDEKAKYLSNKIKQWFLYTFVLWILGFILLIGVFYLLEKIYL